jgi:hypothetical protein
MSESGYSRAGDGTRIAIAMMTRLCRRVVECVARVLARHSRVYQQNRN